MNTVNTHAYHHGHLREELVRIGIERAADGAPEAIGIREASRRAGVSAAAAYRHFAGQEDLRDAVRRAAVARLAGHLETIAAAEPDDAPGEERLRALGRGYIDFARAEPHLFRCLTSGFPMPDGEDGDPFTRLLEEIARAAGREARRDDDQIADAVALLSSAHGFAMLAVAGMLRDVEEGRLAMLRERTLAVAVAGLERSRTAP